MYVIAFIGDLLGMIPIVSIPVSIITAVTLGFVGLFTGVNIFWGSRIIATLAVGVAKAVFPIPFAWTIRVYLAKRDERRKKAAAVATQAQSLPGTF